MFIKRQFSGFAFLDFCRSEKFPLIIFPFVLQRRRKPQAGEKLRHETVKSWNFIAISVLQ